MYPDDVEPGPDREAPLQRPAIYRWVVWVMVAMLFVGPLYTFISVFQLAPALVITVAGLSIAFIYFIRGSRNPAPSRER